MFTQDHFSNFILKDTGRKVNIKQVLTKYKILQTVMRYELSFFGMPFTANYKVTVEHTNKIQNQKATVRR